MRCARVVRAALDAARPLFEQSQVYVSRTDAVFVDAIHTSSGWTVLQKSLGMGKPYGHVDFYPNGGRNQPGCGGLLGGYSTSMESHV